MIYGKTDPRVVQSAAKQIGTFNLGKNIGKGCGCTSQPNEQDAMDDAQLSCDFVVKDGEQLTMFKGETPTSIDNLPNTGHSLVDGTLIDNKIAV